MKLNNYPKIFCISLIVTVGISLISCELEPSPNDSAEEDRSDIKSRYLADFCQHCLSGTAMYHCDALAHAGIYDIKGEFIIAKFDECYRSCDSSCMIKLINSLD